MKVIGSHQGDNVLVDIVYQLASARCCMFAGELSSTERQSCLL